MTGGVNMSLKKYILERKIEKSTEYLKAKLIKRFHSDKKVTKKEISDIAKDNFFKEEEVDEVIYNILSDFLFRTRDKREIEVDKAELEMGIEEEMEHTDDPEIAKIIALDHLYSVKNYYTLLKYVEKENKK